MRGEHHPQLIPSQTSSLKVKLGRTTSQPVIKVHRPWKLTSTAAAAAAVMAGGGGGGGGGLWSCPASPPGCLSGRESAVDDAYPSPPASSQIPD